jgi:Cd2+/Zn2+-exporting ATPase
LVLLVIACPCALVISTPVTVVSGLAAAARRGILIKGGVHLEDARKIKAIALDKTGTITEGKPELVAVFEVVAADHVEPSSELGRRPRGHSDHPVSKGDRGRAWDSRTTDSSKGSRPSLVVASKPITDGLKLILGNHRLIEDRGPVQPAD